MIKFYNCPASLLEKLFFCFALLLILNKCNIDPALIDWRLAAQSPLNSFPQALRGEYYAKYSSKLLSGKIDCGEDRLLVQKNLIRLICGSYILAYCIPKTIHERGKNYEVLCDPSFLLEYPTHSTFEIQNSRIAKPKGFRINYVSQDRIAIVNDSSSSMNRIYKKKGLKE